MQFKEVLAYPFTKSEHINLLEMRAHKTWAVRASKSVSCWRSRHVRLMDSGVCTGALGRGRSSSRKLNGLLCSTLPFVGPTELVVGPVWTRSEDNAADDPTRGRPVRDAGPIDLAVLAYIQEAGGRFEHAIDASRRLLAARATRLPRQLLEVLTGRTKQTSCREENGDTDGATAPQRGLLVVRARPICGARRIRSNRWFDEV